MRVASLIRSRRAIKAVALFIILSICGILLAFTGVVGSGAVFNLRATYQQEQLDQARYVAQGGIAAALDRLSRPPQYPTPSSPPVNTQNHGFGACWSDVDYYLAPDITKIQSTTNEKISAVVQVYNNTSAAFHRSSELPDGTPIPEGKIFVISSGLFEDGQRRSSTTVGALLRPRGVNFERSVFGKASISLSSCQIFSVDSSVAGWTPATDTAYDPTSAPRRTAHLASKTKFITRWS